METSWTAKVMLSIKKFISSRAMVSEAKWMLKQLDPENPMTIYPAGGIFSVPTLGWGASGEHQDVPVGGCFYETGTPSMRGSYTFSNFSSFLPQMTVKRTVNIFNGFF